MSRIANESLAKTSRQWQRRGRLLRTLVQWHWISSAVCLVGMLMFAVTGITLNHAGQIASEPTVVSRSAELPPELLESLGEGPSEGSAPLPSVVAEWLGEQFAKPIGVRPAEWNEDEVYLSLPGPGSDAWLAIDRFSGEAEFESTDRGWVAYFNDLHKGRNTGAAWKWLIDLFAIATLVFCLTGLGLLYLHAQQRRMTWPLVLLGLVAPLLLTLLLVH